MDLNSLVCVCVCLCVRCNSSYGKKNQMKETRSGNQHNIEM